MDVLVGSYDDAEERALIIELGKKVLELYLPVSYQLLRIVEAYQKPVFSLILMLLLLKLVVQLVVEEFDDEVDQLLFKASRLRQLRHFLISQVQCFNDESLDLLYQREDVPYILQLHQEHSTREELSFAHVVKCVSSDT